MQFNHDNRLARNQDKKVLKALYPEYNPKQHDVFVMRFNKDQDKINLNNYLVNRGLSANAEN